MSEHVEVLKQWRDERKAISFGTHIAEMRDAALDAAIAALTRSEVPAGWKLVPVRPTVDMIEFGKERILSGMDYERAQRCWDAMLAHAPAPPTDSRGAE